MSTQYLLSLLVLLPLPLFFRSILVYDLNRNLPPKAVQSANSPDLECLSSKTSVSLPSQISICFRYRPVSILYGQGAYGMVSLSKMGVGKNKTKVVGGFVWARYRRGVWLGVMLSSGLQWSRLGDGAGQNVLGWKHACLSIDWDTGEVFMIENGKVKFNQRLAEVARAYQAMNRNLTTVTVGCYHGYGKLSTRGPVTDFHMYGRNLYQEEMTSFTTCGSSYPEGDIVRWNKTSWVLNTKDKLSEAIVTSFEEDVCSLSNRSTVLIPRSRSFPDPCEALSGYTIGYHTKFELYSLARQIARSSNMVDRGMCVKPFSNNTYKTFLPTAGKRSSWWVWTNTITGNNITYLPWVHGRPVIKDESYHCMFLNLLVEVVPKQEFGNVVSIEIEGTLQKHNFFL